MTVQDIITSSYRKLNLVQPGGTPSTDESNTALTCLQGLMGGWNAGLTKALAGTFAASLVTFVPLPGYVSLGDLVTLDASTVKAVTYALAVELATELGIDPPAVVVAIAAQMKLNLCSLPNVL